MCGKILFVKIHVIFKDFSMLTNHTGLLPNQPTAQKVKNLHNFGVSQQIWLKLGTQTQNGRTMYGISMHVIYVDFSSQTSPTRLPPNQPIGSKVKKVFNFVDF